MDQIIITGIPRSGTTILGNIIGSCRDVEYFIEPPMFPSLFFELIDNIKEEEWKRLYENYRDYELMNESLAGRRLNFNPHDQSYIYKIKSEEEINERLSRTWRSEELDKIRKAKKFSFKTPIIGNWVNKLKGLYPGIKIVVVVREIEQIIESIRKKGWFNDNSNHYLRAGKRIGDFWIPKIIPESWYEGWKGMKDYERSLLFVNYQLKAIKDLQDVFVLNYERLSDKEELDNLFSYIDCQKGHKTEQLIESINLNESNHEFEFNHKKLFEEAKEVLESIRK